LIGILEEYKKDFVYTLSGHLGDGNFHVIPLADMNIQSNKDRVVEIADKVYDLAIRYHGSITAEHNDGIVRTPYLPEMYEEKMMELFQKTKDILDSGNISIQERRLDIPKRILGNTLRRISLAFFLSRTILSPFHPW